VPDPWEVTFKPYDLSTGGPVEGALVEVYKSDGTVLESGVADANGEVSLSIPTSGTPIDGYFMASKTGYLPTRFRIQGGLGWFTSWRTMMVTEAFADDFGSSTWPSETRDPNAAVVMSKVFDCNKGSEAWGLPDATFSVAPAGLGFIYTDVTGNYPPAQAATSRNGSAVTANVPAGDNAITVSLDGTDTTYDRPMLAGTVELVVLYPKAGPAECHPADTSGYTPEWKPSGGLAQGFCTDKQATDYLASCFGSSATTAACNAWKADSANDACLACELVHEDDPIRNALVLFESLGFYGLDFGSCMSAFEDDLSDASCGAKYQAADACGNYACGDNCSIESATFALDNARFRACKSEASEGECKDYWDAVNACTDTLLYNGDPIDQCLSQPNEEFLTTAERYIKLVCGDGTG